MTRQQKPLPAPTPPGWQEIALKLWLRFRRFASDVGGVFITAFSLMTLLALWGITEGALLSPWAAFLRRWLGGGSLLVVLIVAWLGVSLVRQRFGGLRNIPWARVIWLEAAAFAFIALLAVFGGVDLPAAEAGRHGGLVGWGLAELLGLMVGGFLRVIFLVLIVIVAGLSGLGLMRRVLDRLGAALEAGAPAAAPLGEPPAPGEQPAPAGAPATGGRRKPQGLPAEFRKKLSLPEEKESAGPPPDRDQTLPPLDLLQGGRMPRPNERNINLTAGMIEKTLAEFGIPAQVVGVQVGPTVTQFAVEPGFFEKSEAGEQARKVRVTQIASLQKDLALALSAERLRIEAPVPGKSYIGIEVPNLDSVIVRLRHILESPAFAKANSPLALAMGLDVSGSPVVANLKAMPHLLIAGTTGSGKSVCITALTTCLALNNSPESLRLVMIDPKKVELVRFNGLPHLFGRVETDLERILGVLRWTVAEMDRRYKLLEAHRARNLDTFNAKTRPKPRCRTLW
jgi:S-DNA-T family DNA segregation ATPase FtsK/SpoIIIE